MAPSGIFNSHLIVASAIERNGTEEQKRKYLPRMASGELRGSIGLTEPNAGSDLQAIRTTAQARRRRLRRQRQQDVDHQQPARALHAAAGEDRPDAQPRHKGMSLLIAEKGPGYNVDGKLKKMGYRSIDTCELNFDNYRVPKDNLLGGVEGKGFVQTAGGLELGRINVAARGAGIAEGALKLALRYAQERSAFGKPIWQHQAVQLKLADMVTQVEGAEAADRAGGAQVRPRRALRPRSGDGQARGLRGRRVLRAGRRCASSAATATRWNTTSSAIYRDAMLMCIGEGTNEILRQVIAKQLVDRHRI